MILPLFPLETYLSRVCYIYKYIPFASKIYYKHEKLAWNFMSLVNNIMSLKY